GSLEGATGTFSGKLSTQQDIDVGRRINVLWSYGEESGIFFKGPGPSIPHVWIKRTSAGDLEIYNDEGSILIDGLNVLSLSVESGVYLSFIDRPLWTGQAYPLDTQTVRPSKLLSWCMTGWILRWQTYTPGTGTSESNFQYTIIP